MPTTSRLLLTALGQDDIDELIDQLYPAGESAAETKLIRTLKELEEAVRNAPA